MTDGDASNGVRVTNAEIYRLQLETNGRVTSVQQTIREVVLPRLETHETRINSKADGEALKATNARVATLELRLYAIGAGLVAAVIGGKGLGIL